MVQYRVVTFNDERIKRFVLQSLNQKVNDDYKNRINM